MDPDSPVNQEPEHSSLPFYRLQYARQGRDLDRKSSPSRGRWLNTSIPPLRVLRSDRYPHVHSCPAPSVVLRRIGQFAGSVRDGGGRPTVSSVGGGHHLHVLASALRGRDGPRNMLGRSDLIKGLWCDFIRGLCGIDLMRTNPEKLPRAGSPSARCPPGSSLQAGEDALADILVGSTAVHPQMIGCMAERLPFEPARAINKKRAFRRARSILPRAGSPSKPRRPGSASRAGVPRFRRHPGASSSLRSARGTFRTRAELKSRDHH